MNITHPYEPVSIPFRHRDISMGVALALAMLFGAASARGEEAKPVNAAGEQKPTLQLGLGRAGVVKTPWPVKRVVVSSPNIADVQVLDPDQVMVIGKAAGSTDLIFWNEQGETHNTLVEVTVDQGQLNSHLAKLFPGAQLEVKQVQDALVVRGKLRSGDEVVQLRQLMESNGSKFVDMTTLEGVQQVMIKVRVAEASRQALRALNVNSVYAGNDYFGGVTLGGNANSINVGVPSGAPATKGLPFVFNSETSISSAVTMFAGFPGADLQLFIEALENNQYLRVLAEPTLVALSGQDATFLAGGEFPIPIVQNAGGASGSNGSISVEYKEFGVSLKFRPLVMGNDTIKILVAPEVSDISDVGAVEISGFRIPAIITRRSETTLQMKNGQTFAMAGLINRKTSARVGQIPGLGDLPVLGSLFRSVRYEHGETEMLVLVTVSLVEPLDDAADRPLPGDLHTEPNNWELYSHGQIHGKPSPAAAQWLKAKGLDRLRGPGAWSNYEQRLGQ